jgi:hypothetical protein
MSILLLRSRGLLIAKPCLVTHQHLSPNPEASVLEDFCLFVFILFTVSRTEGVCRQRKRQRKPAAAPACKPEHRKSSAPSVRSRGMGPPYRQATSLGTKKGAKRKRFIRQRHASTSVIRKNSVCKLYRSFRCLSTVCSWWGLCDKQTFTPPHALGSSNRPNRTLPRVSGRVISRVGQ